MTEYKVSVVVTDRDATGVIMDMDKRPQVGEIIKMEGKQYTILEVVEVTPPSGDFHFLHVTCKPLSV